MTPARGPGGHPGLEDSPLIEAIVGRRSRRFVLGGYTFADAPPADTALPAGEYAYVGGPPAPYGSLADLIPVPSKLAFPVPKSVDPALAAALGVSGFVSWLSLEYRGQLQPDESGPSTTPTCSHDWSR